MNLAQIAALRAELDNERISYGEIHAIESAFEALVASGATFSDDPENAMAGDMLDELEAAAIRKATTVIGVIDVMSGEPIYMTEGHWESVVSRDVDTYAADCPHMIMWEVGVDE